MDYQAYGATVTDASAALALASAAGFLRNVVAGVAGVIGAVQFGDMFMSVMRRTMSMAKKKVNVDTEEIIKLRRQIVSIHKRLKTLKSDAAIAKYQDMLKQAYEVLAELEARQGNQVAEAGHAAAAQRSAADPLVSPTMRTSSGSRSMRCGLRLSARSQAAPTKSRNSGAGEIGRAHV